MGGCYWIEGGWVSSGPLGVIKAHFYKRSISTNVNLFNPYVKYLFTLNYRNNITD